MRKLSFLLLIIVILPFFMAADLLEDENLNGILNIANWNKLVSGGLENVKSDENDDGETDYILYYTSSGNKVAEVMDFNYDGKMDDFYFYKNGVLQFRQIDSNFDGKIDIWVYITKGVYIKKFERDSDFDGEIDFVKDYDKEE